MKRLIPALLVAAQGWACLSRPVVDAHSTRIARVENGLSRRQAIHGRPDRMIFEFGDEKSVAGELQFGPVTFERIDP